jgi:RND family efflux transporter MFP subunit
MKKRLPLNIGNALVAALGIGVGVRVILAASGRSDDAEAAVAATISVSVEVAARRDLVEQVELTGTVRPSNEVDVFTKVPGRVEQVLVEVGDHVVAGQVLAVIEHHEIALQGQQVRAQASGAAAALEQAMTNRDNAQLQAERARVLRRENVVTQADLDRLEAALRAAEAAVRVAEAQVGATRAAVALAGQSLDNASVTTPIAGTVTRRNVGVGFQATQAQPLFRVQDVGSLKVAGSVTAMDFVRLRAGQAVAITVDELPDRSFAGRVATLSPSLDPQTRRAAVEVAIDNPEGALLPNMFARVRVDVGRREGVVTVPREAVVSTTEGRFAFVVREGRAARVALPREAGDGEHVPAGPPVSEGDLVVVSGQAGLTDGAAVRVAGGGVEAPAP